MTNKWFLNVSFCKDSPILSSEEIEVLYYLFAGTNKLRFTDIDLIVAAEDLCNREFIEEKHWPDEAPYWSLTTKGLTFLSDNDLPHQWGFR